MSNSAIVGQTDTQNRSVSAVVNAAVQFTGRVFSSAIFLISGLSKLAAPAATIGYIQSVGLPFAQIGFAIVRAYAPRTRLTNSSRVRGSSRITPSRRLVVSVDPSMFTPRNVMSSSMPTVSNGAVSATVPSPWSHGRSPAPAGRARGSSASGGGSWTLPQARERAMARADHVRAGLTIRCAVYTRAPRRSRCGLAPRRAHAAWMYS